MNKYVYEMYIYHTWKKVSFLATGCSCAKHNALTKKQYKIVKTNEKLKEKFT